MLLVWLWFGVREYEKNEEKRRKEEKIKKLRNEEKVRSFVLSL